MSDDDFIRLARERREEGESADLRNRELARDDLRMAIGDQWPEEIRRDREAEGKPCITINALPQYLRRVTAEIRELNPGLKVSPADSGAQEDVAEIFEGLIRHIEYNSDAASIFEQAAESAAACGIGHFRARADYVDSRSFDQEILIERIHNPFSVVWDPLAKHPTRMDAGFCFLLEEMRSDDFKKAYPGKQTSDVTAEHKERAETGWFAADTVTVAEYFYIEHEEITLGLLDDGTVLENPPAVFNVVRTRKAQRPRVKWAKISGAEILEGPTDVPGEFIPVFAVTGEEWHLGEEMYRSGVIRFAKDAQQIYNYAWSAVIETAALQPKAPYMVTAKQIAGLEEFWNDANGSNRPYLPYNADEKAPAPQRVSPPVASQALTQQLQIAAEDMKRTTGIYDASLGARSNETSGVAIQARQREAQMSTSIYADNMVKAIRQCGRVLVDMIPAIYDTQRTIRIMAEDDQEKMVMINGIMQTQDGIQPINDLSIGRYDVRVRVGPSYDTKRQEASTGMLEFVRAFPAAAGVTADLVAKSQDWPDADRFAERLRKTLPPGVIDIEDMEPEQQQQAMQAMQQAQQIEQMQAQMQQMQAQLEMAEAQAKIGKIQADAQKTAAETDETRLDAADKQLDLAVKSGQLNAVIEQAVARALMGVRAQPAPPPQGQMQRPY